MTFDFYLPNVRVVNDQAKSREKRKEKKEARKPRTADHTIKSAKEHANRDNSSLNMIMSVDWNEDLT